MKFLIEAIKSFPDKALLFLSKRRLSPSRLTKSRLYKRGELRFEDPSFNKFVVGLMRVRNEANIIEFSLKALAQYTDAIIVLDDCSNDGTSEIIQTLKEACQIKQIIRKDEYVFDEWGDRTALLKSARQLGGTHFIVLDADEALTSNFQQNNLLRKLILGLEPGDVIKLILINLWRGVNQYRRDHSVWTGTTFPIVLCDDGKSELEKGFAHFPRLPVRAGKQHIIQGDEYGLLHFQYVNWRNLLIKQAWYRCLEKLHLPNKTTAEINARYAPSKDESGLGTSPCHLDWLDGYPFFTPNIFERPETWREKQIGKWIQEYGEDYFSHLDIWDIDWNFEESRS
ncbi:MAG: glycosyltransferase [Chloroflexi bacterium]|nr:glycosyltransferase [Chloroflexota bacterium]